jgi:hypothetical protein
MSASYLVHNDIIIFDDTIIFDGTNYMLWRNRMLSNLRTLCPNIEQFLDVGFSPPMDLQNLSLEDENNLHLEAQVSNEILLSVSSIVYVCLMGSKCKMSHEIWTKLEESFGGSNSHEVESEPEELSYPSHHEELQVASTSSRDDCSISSTSPTCDMSQGNDMVSGEIICDDGSFVLCTNDSTLLNPNVVESLDLNTSCKKFFTHSCVKGPCISPRICLIKFCDDMLVSSCDHN